MSFSQLAIVSMRHDPALSRISDGHFYPPRCGRTGDTTPFIRGAVVPRSRPAGGFLMRLRPSFRAGGRLGAAVASGALLATVAAPASAIATSPTTSSSTVLTLSSTKIAGVPASIAPGWHTFVLKESAAQAKKDPRNLTVEQFAKGYTRAMFTKDLASTFGPKPNLKAFARVTKNVR